MHSKPRRFVAAGLCLVACSLVAFVPAGATAYSDFTFPTGEAKVKVIVHSTPTERPSSTLEQIDAVMKEVAALYAKWSGGKKTLTYVITETTVPEFDCYGTQGLRKTEAGFDHVIEYGPAKNCPHVGIGTLGGSWVRIVDNGFTAGTVAHELGHNLGLSHANNAICADSVTPWTSCTAKEYGDWFELMGAGLSLGVLDRAILDWHDPTRLVVNPNGELDLAEDPAGIVITDPAGGGEYWVEYARQASNPQLKGDRILVRRTPVGQSRSSNSLLLVKSQEFVFDTTRRVFTRDVGWAAGESFTDPTGQIRIDVLSTAATARVRVTSPQRAPVTLWPTFYSPTRYGSKNGLFQVDWPSSPSHAQSLEMSVRYTDGTVTSSRFRPFWNYLEVARPKSVAVVQFTARELDGRSATSSIVVRQNQWVQSPMKATSVANGIRIDITDPGRYDRLVVDCESGSRYLRIFDKPGARVTVTGTGSSKSCIARVQNLSNGILTVDEALMLPPVKLTSPWVSVGLGVDESSTAGPNGRTVFGIQRSCRVCSRVPVVVQKWNGTGWAKAKSTTMTRSYLDFSVKTRADKWRIKVGKKTYTPLYVETSD